MHSIMHLIGQLERLNTRNGEKTIHVRGCVDDDGGDDDGGGDDEDDDDDERNSLVCGEVLKL